MKNKNIFKLLTATVLVALLALASCQKMEVVKIVGYIQGHVFDGNTNAPLDSVKIVWSVAGKKDSLTASAQDGYLIENLPLGEYSIWCSKANYTTIVYNVGIYDSDNSSVVVRGGGSKEQIETVNPNLYPLNASLTGRVYKYENGVSVPIAGATIQLDYNSSNANPAQYYRFVPNLYEVTTDDDGYFTFTNVPATSTQFRILNYTDENGETYDRYSRYIYLDAATNYAMGKITLSRLDDPIRLVNSNAWSATNEGTDNFAVSDDITLTFNKDVDETITKNKGGGVWLRDETGNIVATTITYSGNVITINPDEDLMENKQYNIEWDVYSSQDYDNTSDDFYFRTVNNTVVPGAVTNFAIDYDVMGSGWIADYNTRAIWFKWDMINGAEEYEIYVKDSYNNTEYTKVFTFTQDDNDQGTYSAYTYLPNKFDYFEDDNIITPFSHGTQITYKVRAVNSAGAGPFSDEITVKDETPFDDNDMDIYNQDVTADNSGGTSDITVTLEFRIYTGLYADVNHIPTVKLYNGGTEVTPITATFTWDTHQHATITLTVPAGQNYNSYQLRVYDVNDSSGNTMDPTDYEGQTLY